MTERDALMAIEASSGSNYPWTDGDLRAIVIRCKTAETERDASRHELRVALGRLSKAETERDEARARATEWEAEAIRAKAARP